jgi:hypothetical protein
MPAKLVEIFQENNRYKARVDGGPKFYVGRRVPYEGNVGITNDSEPGGFKYDWQAYSAEGHWAPFIFPTSICESGASMTNINTYDRARFTFGFFQFAAHVKNGDFVRFLRRLLATGSGPDYFPDLLVKNGHIYRVTDTGEVQLESDESTNKLMDYLNPSSDDVQNIEVINAAKFIDGCTQDQALRELQVNEAIVTAKQIMKASGIRYGLDGMIDRVCLVILDIRHHGRAGSQSIIAALQAGATEEQKFNNLIALGSSNYNGRKATLRREIKRLVDAGVLGTKRYRLATNEFV